jgi:hypothetical protein
VTRPPTPKKLRPRKHKARRRRRRRLLPEVVVARTHAAPLPLANIIDVFGTAYNNFMSYYELLFLLNTYF